MTITHRSYQDEDLEPLQNALANWIHQQGHDMGYCHVGDIPHRIYNGIKSRVPRGDIIHIWENGGQIIGLGFAQPYHKGFDAFISPDYLGSQTEKDIFQWSYQTTRQFMNEIGREEQEVCADAEETNIGRQKALEELGFKQGTNWINHTLRDLSEPIPDSILPEGFTIRPSTPDDYAQLAAVHVGSFNSAWTPELYREEVMTKPGYEAEREMVVVAPDGQFAAFTVYWLDELNKVGLFEPVGTHSDFQRKGLGRALMYHTMKIMRKRGMERALVGHGTDNPASTGLYAAVGFKLHHRIYEYKKA